MEGPEIEFEYVDDATSQKLLDKFPDASVYDFDYEESALWSPLPPRSYKYAAGTTFLAEIKPKIPRKNKRSGGRKLVKGFFKRTSRLPLNSSANSLAAAHKGQAWSRLLRVATRCFKVRPSLSSSVHLLSLPRETTVADSNKTKP